MFCTKCGYRISSGITVCPKCGNMIPQQGGAQNSFKNVDDHKFDRNDYLNKYGDIPDMDGVGVDMGDDRMGETIELRFDANNVGKTGHEGMDVTSVIRAEDAPQAVRTEAPDARPAEQSIPAQGAGAVQPQNAAAAQNPQGQYGAPISNHSIPVVPGGQNAAQTTAAPTAGNQGYTQNPLKQEIRYGDTVKKQASKKAWYISGVFAVIALITVIIVASMIKNDAAGASDKKNAGKVAAWGEGFREKHILKHVDAVQATVNTPGMNEYWHCEYCGKDFSDMAGETEVDTATLETFAFDKSLQGVTAYTDGKLYYVKDGVCDTSYNGFEKYNEEMYFFKDGVQDPSFTGLTPDGEAIIYIKEGKSDNTFTGFADYQNEWYIVKNGVVDKTAVDVIKGTVNNEEAWWYVKEGKVTVTDTVAKNNDGWWYIKGGKVEFVDAIGQNENGKWYCKGGKVAFEFTGEVTFDGITYDVKGGKVEGEKPAEPGENAEGEVPKE